MCKIIKYGCYSFIILFAGIVFQIYLNYPVDRIENYHTNKDNKNIENNKEIYDYIVIGSGSSGTVVASRLSENSNLKVLLLEAGGSDSEIKIHIPVLLAELQGTDVDWAYSSTLQIHSKYIHLFMPRGKVIGVSSSLNAMLYVRGTPRDYDNWESLGHKGWGWKDVFPYYKKLEHHLNPRGNQTYYGDSGNVKISINNGLDYVSQLLYKAFKTLYKVQEIDDFNTIDKPVEGISLADATIHNGKRYGVADAYLNKEVLERKNLFVRIHAQVKRILFDDSKRAIGVEVYYSNHNITDTIYVNKEIICSAGAINTPQLLQLSGIGDTKMLKKLKINIVHDNEQVGENLQDHPYLSNMFQLNKPLSLHFYRNFPYDVIAILQWLLFRSGPLSNSVITNIGYFHSNINKKEKENMEWPDMQYLSSSALIRKPEVDNYDHIENGGYTAFSVLLNPKSRGYVTLASADFTDYPRIDPNLFGNKDDLYKMVEAYKRFRNLPNQSPELKEITKGAFHPEGGEIKTDHDIEEHIKKFTDLLYHPVGTCSMGTVVDEKLRLKGVNGLRIVDASIMPQIIRGNTNAACIMIGEKAADMILNDK